MDPIIESWNSYLLKESSLSRIHEHITNHDSAILTAFRNEYSRKNNLRRNRELKAKLLRQGYALTRVDGVFIENLGKENEVEVAESSFFILNRYDGEQFFSIIAELGEEYEQDSALMIPRGGHGAYLLGTSAMGEFPPYGQRFSVGNLKMGHDAEFMSKVGGRPFTFGEGFEVQEKLSKNSRWVVKGLSARKKKQ
jgi:hypothetical protein